MKGKSRAKSKTIWVSGLGALLGVLQFLDMLPAIAEYPRAAGIVTMALSATMYVLRELTSEPLAKRIKRSAIRIAPRDPERNDPRKP